MIPLVCMEYVSIDDKAIFEACTIKYGNTIAYPFFHHYGSEETTPEQCSCTQPNGRSPRCNGFDFLNGLLFYDLDHPEESFLAIFALLLKYGGKQKYVTLAAFNASWY
jgi:hypothetical protein